MLAHPIALIAPAMLVEFSTAWADVSAHSANVSAAVAAVAVAAGAGARVVAAAAAAAVVVKYYIYIKFIYNVRDVHDRDFIALGDLIMRSKRDNSLISFFIAIFISSLIFIKFSNISM